MFTTSRSSWSTQDLETVVSSAVGCAINAASNSCACANGTLCQQQPSSAAWGMKYPLYATAIIGILASITSIVTVVGNIMVLLAFILEKGLRQPSNYLIASLAVTDVLIGMFSMPLYTLYLLSDSYWPLGQWACDLWLSLDYTVCLVSQYTVFLITLDRFCSVKIPAKYRNWRTGCKIKVMIAATWLVPSLVFFISIIGWQYFVGIRTVKPHLCYVQFTDDPLFNTILVISYYWVTLIIMIGLYVGIYKVALGLQVKSEEKRKRISKMTALSSTTNPSSPQPPRLAASKEEAVEPVNGAEQLLRRQAPRPTGNAHSGSLHEQGRGVQGNTLDVPPSKAAVESRPRPTLQRGRRISAVSRSSETDDVSWSDANASEEPGGGSVQLTLVENANGNEPRLVAFNESGSAHAESTSDKPDEFDSPLWRPRDSLPRNSVEWDYFSDAIRLEKLQLETVQNGLTYQRIDVAQTELVINAKHDSKPFLLDKFTRVFAQIAQMTRRSSKKSDAQRSKSENRARKALRTITLILGSFVFFWTPYHIAVLVSGSCGGTCVEETFFAFSYWLCYCNSPINPFCYALANEQFKKSFLKMLKFQYCRRKH